MAELADKLRQAEEKNQRALSMAQQTKAGHVYIISNVGSFGEYVYEVGLTRRLEPINRVRELGDASVPFAFDVHAMIWSENAPDLEKTLHRKFVEAQVNKVNPRRSLFKSRGFSKNTLRMFSEAEVYFARPETFNDPFDCNPAVVSDVEMREVERLWKRLPFGTIPRAETRQRNPEKKPRVSWVSTGTTRLNTVEPTTTTARELTPSSTYSYGYNRLREFAISKDRPLVVSSVGRQPRVARR